VTRPVVVAGHWSVVDLSEMHGQDKTLRLCLSWRLSVALWQGRKKEGILSFQNYRNSRY